MTTSLHLEHFFPCTADELYALVSDPVFDGGLLDAIEVDTEVLSREDTAVGFTASYRFRPRRNMPTFMKKTVGKTMEWVEERAWNHEGRSHRWSIHPSVGAARSDISGTYQITDVGDGRCLRKIDGTFTVRAPLIGGSIEKFVVQQTSDAFERGAQYILEHLGSECEDASTSSCLE